MPSEAALKRAEAKAKRAERKARSQGAKVRRARVIQPDLDARGVGYECFAVVQQHVG
jgi:hypothetical protein